MSENRILYLASFDINKRTGGGLASLCYYNALKDLMPNKVDLVLPEECCYGKYSNAIKVPSRRKIDFFKDFSMHRGKRFIKHYLDKNSHMYDACVINCSRYGGDMMDMIHQYGLKIVMIHHNYEVEFCMTNRYLITFRGHFPFWVSWIEKNAYLKADINCFLTLSDKEKITSRYGKVNGLNYILGVFDYKKEHYVKNVDINTDTIVITGSLNDYQTYKSIEIFGKEILPTLFEKYPDIKVKIAGRNPVDSICQLHNRYPNNVEVIANPPDMDEVLNEANIYVCPTSIGSGIKLRIMDGLKKGLPVLVHKISARGYETINDGRYFISYSDKDSFFIGLTAILNSIKENKDYSDVVIESYAKQFSYEAGLQRMREILIQLGFEAAVSY